MNARGITPAVYHVFLCCSFPGKGGGYPIQPGPGGYSHPVLARAIPHPVLEVSHPGMARGYPILTWLGYPLSGPDGGTPNQALMGVPLPLFAGGGTPCGLARKLKIFPSPIFLMRAVITLHYHSRSIPMHQGMRPCSNPHPVPIIRV